jgi:hypothetical protein
LWCKTCLFHSVHSRSRSCPSTPAHPRNVASHMSHSLKRWSRRKWIIRCTCPHCPHISSQRTCMRWLPGSLPDIDQSRAAQEHTCQCSEKHHCRKFLIEHLLL